MPWSEPDANGKRTWINPDEGGGGGGGSGIPVGTTKVMGDTWKEWDGKRWFDTGVPATSAPRSDTTPDLRYDSSGNAYRWDITKNDLVRDSRFDDPTKAAGYRAPSAPPAPRFPQGGIEGGNVYTVDPYTGQITFSGRVPGSLTEAEKRQNELSDLSAARTFTTGERLGGEQFRSGESALDRALNAGQFASTMQARQRELQFNADQDYQNRLRQFAQDKLNAAQTFASMVGATDPAALESFYAAGGGNISNALQSGASAVSNNAVLPAAQALRTSREMLAPTRFTGFDSPFQLPSPPTMAAGGQPNLLPFQPPRVAAPPPVPAPPVNMLDRPETPAWVKDDSLRTWLPEASASAPVAAPASFETPAPAFAPRFGPDNGSGDDFFPPRYAMGTMGEPAKGTFITGDSTHPTDPFADGAKPEKVTLKDPPGPNNAEAEVEPMSPPEGMGMGGSKLADLLHSIAAMLDGGMRMNMGGMMHMPDMEKDMPRYAFGTGYESIQPTPADDPYMQEVRRIRQNVQFPQLNPYDVQFGFTPASLRSRYFAGMQTRFGVPIDDQMQEQQRYALRGTSRGAVNFGT